MNQESDLSIGSPLRQLVAHKVRQYLRQLDTDYPHDIYEFILKEFDRGLLQEVMQHCEHNQSRAAQLLGLARGTLRKKLADVGLLQVND